MRPYPGIQYTIGERMRSERSECSTRNWIFLHSFLVPEYPLLSGYDLSSQDNIFIEKI